MISGVGELDIEKDTPKKEDAEAKDLPYPDCPFLLLDVRDRDAYDQCHIVGGEEMESYYSLCQLGSHTALCVVLAGQASNFPPEEDIPWLQNLSALIQHTHPSWKRMRAPGCC